MPDSLAHSVISRNSSVFHLNFKKDSISCHKNTKFLHTIAEDFSFIMNQKWKRYVYLETNTRAGKVEFEISKYVITRRLLQFTHCAVIRFLRRCLRKSLVTFTSSNSFLCDSVQNTAQRKVLHSIFGSML